MCSLVWQLCTPKERGEDCEWAQVRVRWHLADSYLADFTQWSVSIWCRKQSPKKNALLELGSCMSPRSPCMDSSVLSLWHCEIIIKPCGCGACCKEVRLQGLWREGWVTSPQSVLLSLCLQPHGRAGFLCCELTLWCIMLLQDQSHKANQLWTETSEIMSQYKLFLFWVGLLWVFVKTTESQLTYVMK